MALESPSKPPFASLMRLPIGPSLLKFGVVCDIQYAPIEDGFSFGGTPRYYRHALETLSVASTTFKERSCIFALNIGDIIDGKCKAVSLNVVEAALASIRSGMNKFDNPWHTVYGNHELYCLERKRFKELCCEMHEEEDTESTGDSSDDRLVGYSAFSPPQAPKFRFIRLDSFDVSLMGRSKSSTKHKEATTFLSINTNHDKNSPINLLNLDQRFVAFNGAVGKAQLQWLTSELESCQAQGLQAIILSHAPFYPPVAPEICLLWNYDDVLNVLAKFKSNVAATLCGHTHNSAYAMDEESGIHHFVFKAALESVPPIKTFNIFTLFENGIEVEGFGDEAIRTGFYEI